jgi:hypothetical protein
MVSSFIWATFGMVLIILVPLHCLTELQMFFFLLVFLGYMCLFSSKPLPSEEEVEEGIQTMKKGVYYPLYKIMDWVMQGYFVISFLAICVFAAGVVIAIAVTLITNAS